MSNACIVLEKEMRPDRLEALTLLGTPEIRQNVGLRLGGWGGRSPALPMPSLCRT